MRSLAPLAFLLGISLLAFAAFPGIAAQVDNGTFAAANAADPRLEILRSELALTAKQIERVQNEMADRLPASGSLHLRLRAIDRHSSRLGKLERRCDGLTHDWHALSEAEASDRFHRLQSQMHQLQREVSDSRRALHSISNRRAASHQTAAAPLGTGAISGSITEEGTGTPISGTWVEIYDSSGSWVVSDSTDSSGAYTSGTILGTGDYYLRTYNSSGYINELYDDMQCVGWCTVTGGTPVSVTDGVETSDIDFALTPGGRISGSLTDESSFAPIPGVYLDIYDTSGNYVSDGSSNSSGNYLSGPGLPTGSYYARTWNDDGYINELYDDIPCVGSCTVTSGTPISVTTGATTSGIDFELTPGGRISGTVKDGGTSLPIASIWVSIYDGAGNYITNDYTDAAGLYTSEAGLPTGTYYALTGNNSSYLNELYDDIDCSGSCTVTDGTPISVTTGATTSGIDFDLLKGGAIEGTVTEDGSGTPLDSGYVRIYDASGNSMTSAYPDSSGNYHTSVGLSAGTYYALARSFEGYLDELYDDMLCASGCTVTDGTPILVTASSTTSGIDFALAQGGFIAGTVTEDGSGDGLDTGYVNIYDASGSYLVSVYPAASGAYITYNALAAGTYYARTWSFEGYFDELYDDISCASGCTVTDGTPILVTAGATTSGIDFALLKAGSITGTVTEEGTGTGLEDVYVDVYDSSGSWAGESRTDASGDYTIQTGLTTGTYYARTFNSDHYLNELYDDLSCWDSCTITGGTPISVTTGSTTSGIDFALTPGGIIEGTVTDDDSLLALEDIDIYFYDDSGGYITSARTDAGGDYTSESGLLTGTYHLKTWNDDGYINELYDDLLCVGGCTVTDGTAISVTAGATTSGIDIALVLGGSISGSVTADGSGTPLDTGYVRIYDDDGNNLVRAYPDATGSYVNGEGLPTGTYYALARSFEGYLQELYDDILCAFGCTPTEGTPIPVTEGSTTTDIDFELAEAGGLAGTVTDDSTHAGLDTGWVRLYDASGTSVRYLYPDSSGDYSADDLPAGTYYARTESFEGYWDELYDNFPCTDGCTVTTGTPIVVVSGATTSGIDFELARGGAISGTVTDAGSHLGLDFGRVNIYDSDGDWITRGYPDASGAYVSQKPLVAGTYYALTSSFEGYIEELYDNIPCVGSCTVTDGTPIVVAANATTSGIDFELAVGGLISGTVTDESTHAGLDTGYVDIYNAAGTWVTSGWPDASGTYLSSAGLPSGTYYARAWSFDGYFNELYDDISCNSGCTVTDGTPILVAAGSTTSGVDFELAKGGVISGTITDEVTGLPLDSGYVNLYNSSGNYVGRGYPDSSGLYSCETALETGTYYARTYSFEDYFEELYSEISCEPSCTVTDGTPIAVTLGSTTSGIDFTLLGWTMFADGFESGDVSAWTTTKP